MPTSRAPRTLRVSRPRCCPAPVDAAARCRRSGPAARLRRLRSRHLLRPVPGRRGVERPSPRPSSPRRSRPCRSRLRPRSGPAASSWRRPPSAGHPDHDPPVGTALAVPEQGPHGLALGGAPGRARSVDADAVLQRRPPRQGGGCRCAGSGRHRRDGRRRCSVGGAGARPGRTAATAGRTDHTRAVPGSDRTPRTWSSSPRRSVAGEPAADEPAETSRTSARGRRACRS